MKKLIKTFLLLCFFFSAIGQENTLKAHINDFLYDSVYSIKPRIFLLNSLESSHYNNTYLLGLSCNVKINDKLSIVSQLDYLNGNHIRVLDTYKDSLDIFSGFGSRNERVLFKINYDFSKFFNLEYGQGKNFIGDGYRSLLLSNTSSHYPYLSISTKFKKIKYYNLYSSFTNPSAVNYGRKKYSALHFLSFNINDHFSIGLFEAILWQSKTIDRNGGYEIAYLNPIIFYRPVEFSMGSNKGNALMGATTKINYKQHTIYGQILLDDLNISRQKDNDAANYSTGFFQNKYGYQLGVRSKYKEIKFLLEYNQIQPYTYGHRTVLQNYSHMNQALAHPLGANFKEFINVIEYQKGNYKYMLKSMIINIGLDSLNTHYGQNIFASDYDASTGGQASYGNYNGQGVSTNILILRPEITYKLKHFDIFSSIYYIKKKSDLIDQTSCYFFIGIRNIPFSIIPF